MQKQLVVYRHDDLRLRSHPQDKNCAVACPTIPPQVLHRVRSTASRMSCPHDRSCLHGLGHPGKRHMTLASLGRLEDVVRPQPSHCISLWHMQASPKHKMLMP